MAYFTVIDNGVVVNTIVAESKEIAELVTNKTCIEYEFTTGGPSIGQLYADGVFSDPVSTEQTSNQNEGN
jgi:hypothetical protein